jgi:glycosyltransferase involved in cell wall biosynthesis
MRILIVNSLYRPLFFGGAEKSVSLLAEALARTGDQVSVITLHPGSEETFEELNGVRVYRVPLDNSYWPWGLVRKPNPLRRLLWHIRDFWNGEAAKRVGRILDIERPDVVHTNCLGGLSVSIWREVKKRNIRLVHTLRDYHLLCPRTALFRNGSNCERRCFMCKVLTVNRKPASKQFDTVVSNSDYVLKEHMRRGYFKSTPSSVIYNVAGGDIKHDTPARSDDSDILVFGFIGGITPEKGVEVVLKATAKLVNCNWRLKIAGAGSAPYVEHLQRSHPDPRIQWLGFVSANEFYHTTDVTVVSSVWAEPLPRTLIETFASGNSAICARSGGIPEIASLGKVVETYPAKDAEALARIMDYALVNVELWKRGGFKDSSALDVFSEASITSQYREVYRGNVDAVKQ